MEKVDLLPPLKWAGGKRWLLPVIKKLYVPGTRLVEPFVGAMAISLGLKPKEALLNDINPHLINFYKTLKTGLIINSEFKNERKFFYDLRDEFNSGNITNRRKAELFYYLNRTGFNGLCRFNKKGEFNVPFGRYKSINYIKDFSSYKMILKNWTFTCGDFSKITPEANDFLYVDPPYDVEFTKYSKDSFNWSDQKRLIDWLVELNQPIIASNQATTRIVKLYRDAGFKVKIIDAPRMISSNGDRTPAKEIIATKNL
jgi:DNA adenine methylase